MRFGAVRASDLHDNWLPAAHLYPNPRVKVTHHPRRTFPYIVSTAPPQEPLTAIAQFKAGGDAHTYALTVLARIEETSGMTVEYTAAV